MTSQQAQERLEAARRLLNDLANSEKMTIQERFEAKRARQDVDDVIEYLQKSGKLETTKIPAPNWAGVRFGKSRKE
jgi:hypothetical protein